MKRSRRYTQIYSQVDRRQEYDLVQALELIKKFANAKFDETVEAHINLGVDPRKADQLVRGSVTLPYGLGKVVRVLVLCREDKVKEALEAGADYAGLEEYLEKIQQGWLDFEAVVATPEVMPQVGKVGKILGPRGLMPNPKTGTVTTDIASAVREIKAGRLTFRVDRYGIIHVPVGKASFPKEALVENINSLLSTVLRLKPPTAKGQYFKKMTLSSTMGPGIKLSRSVVSSIK